MRDLILVIGGARSGKSRFALERAAREAVPRRFLATARALDAEMKERIVRHRDERGPEWETVEEPLLVSRVIEEAEGGVLVVDCLTIWLANVMGDDPDCVVEPWVEGLFQALSARRAAVVAVTNEVGWGIVPANRLSRSFRDAAGRLNQGVARIANEVHLLVAGQPLRVK